MLFKPELVRLILEGKKTQTRRPLAGRRLIEVGKVVAVQPGRGKRAVVHIRITGRRIERLGAIRERDAIAEGVRSREEFFALWRRLYGRVDLDEEVVVYEFEVVPPAPSPSRAGPGQRLCRGAYSKRKLEARRGIHGACTKDH